MAATDELYKSVAEIKDLSRTFQYFNNIARKLNPVFLTYVKIIWLNCLFIMMYIIIIVPLIMLIKTTPFKKLFDAIIGKDSIWPVWTIGTLYDIYARNQLSILIASGLFVFISTLFIGLYILFLIALFIHRIIPFLNRNAPRKWPVFKRLKDVFDLFEFKISIFDFIFKSILEMIVVLFFAKEKFENMPNDLYIDEIEKKYYDDTKEYYKQKKNLYKVYYTISLNHTLEANKLSQYSITTSKENYNTITTKNNTIDSTFDFKEKLKNAFST